MDVNRTHATVSRTHRPLGVSSGGLRLFLLTDAARVGKILDPDGAGTGPRLIVGVFTGTYVTRRA